MTAFESSKIIFTTLVGFVFCLIMMYNLELIRYDKGNIIIHLEGNPYVSTNRDSRPTVTGSEPTTPKTATTSKTTSTPTTAKQCDQKLDSETKSLIRKALDKTIQLKELFRQQSQTLTEKNKDVLPVLNYFKRLAKPLENSLLNDLELLYDKAWKEDAKELQELNRIAQSMISQTQNPKNCTRAKKLHCVMNHMTCGFGCIIHDYGLCAFVSIGESRTLQYDMNQLATYPGINTTFEYPSETCVNRTNFGNYKIEWHPKLHKDAPSSNKEVLTMTINEPSTSHSQFSPGTVPQHLIERLQLVHSDPNAWWTGHVISYLVRPQKWVLEELKTIKREIEFEHPIVGIHVRRTDKISEASYFGLERYMDHVESWYDRYQLKHPKEKVVRRIYLATDDAQVVKEAKNSYPHYKILFTIGRTFNNSQNRKSNSAVKGVLFDALLLKDSDFVVVTFSSNVSSLVELRLGGLVFPS
uniref:alpha-(1,6)-fucosyltransferase-like isoform X2 n=1 Tax=Ciona intestinalis TaxID=7719 RepID=UPI000EF4ADD8|nr:alpha-(1,6)-fucosyltransferase-like isoform X2 [Ciona intestinalis]|eukprot:XP_026695846.1 alpha-(1,6)-fucosyltransferase-like isoform X2 [Ciona intestinalis]